MLYDCVAEWVCMVTLTFCIFGQSGWMSLVCYFVPIKRFNLHKMCIMVWFVLLKTFFKVQFRSRNSRGEWGGFGLVSDVRDWH